MSPVSMYSFDGTWSRNTLLKIPDDIQPTKANRIPDKDIINIVMVDVSASMRVVWATLKETWSSVVAPKMRGYTKVFVFGDSVRFVRDNSAVLKQDDFMASCTNLTAALHTIMDEIRFCRQKNVRVFLITDGDHNSNNEPPGQFIESMEPSMGKTIEVYLFAIGMSFPVEYSINIRSRLHNGPSSIPSIFWAKTREEVVVQVDNIASELTKIRSVVKLNTRSSYLPGADDINHFFLSDWIFIQRSPEELRHRLEVCFENGEKLDIENKGNLPYSLFRHEVMPQWNSLILKKFCSDQRFNQQQIYDIMENQYEIETAEMTSELASRTASLKDRLKIKALKTMEIDFRTMINESKALIETRGKYRTEIDFANLIIKTTTSGKYEDKGLKYKGHSTADYEEDMEKFKEIYTKLKPKIMELSTDFDDSCRVTASSTISDLQEPDIEELFQLSKYEFLKTITLTGIPILMKLKDSSGMNPWTIHIKHILINPFEVLSQRALEFGAESTGIQDSDKSVLVKQADESTRFNAVIPVYPKGTVQILKPLLTTKMYAVCCTFSILKNTLIIDYECHIAALACVWLKTVAMYPRETRPEFIKKRIEYIDETAGIYSGRKGLKNYSKCLVTTPNVALMTESGTTIDETNIRCEALTKPAFLMHIYYNELKPSVEVVLNIFHLMLIEYIGRCMSSHHNTEPFSTFFIPEFEDKEKRQEWYDGICQPYIQNLVPSGDELLKKFYFPGKLNKVCKLHTKQATRYIKQHIEGIDIQINKNKLNKMRNSGSCGDVSWKSLAAWGHEIGLDESTLSTALSDEMIARYLYHGLKYKSSKERMNAKFAHKEDMLALIKDEIIQENVLAMQKLVLKDITKLMKERWLNAYSSAHKDLVSPMTQEEIIDAATKLGVLVDSLNFNDVYKYRLDACLLRNACMSSRCPHYLQPNCSFNEHIYTERQLAVFPHNLHNITVNNLDDSPMAIVQKVKNCTPKRQVRKKKKNLQDSIILEEFVKNEIPTLIEQYRNTMHLIE